MTKLVALVAEDEADVRAVAADALTEAGFQVIEVADADQAIIALEAQGDTIDALFTDLKLPGCMDGLDLAHHVKDRWPWVRLMMTSGQGRPDEASGIRFLPKPYDAARVPVHMRSLIVSSDERKALLF